MLTEYSFVFCCGFPKCGTTTISAILETFPECSVHVKKESNFFLQNKIELDDFIEDFRITSNIQYLVDFSTRYGVSSQRSIFLENLKKSNILSKSKFIVCIREPEDQARSYLKHLKTRYLNSGHSSLSDEQILLRIKESQDYISCLDELLTHTQPNNVFLIKFDDIISIERQRNIYADLRKWLGVEQLAPPKKVIKLNEAKSYAEYRGILKRFTDILKRIRVHTYLPLTIRQELRMHLGYKPEVYQLTNDDLVSLGCMYHDSSISEFYSASESGCLAEYN